MVATTATIILVAATVASTAVAVAGQIRQAEAQAKSARFQARLQDRAAQRARDLAKANEAEFRRQQSRKQGVQRARFGASGLDVAGGTPLGVIGDTAKEIGFQAQKILAGGQVQAQGLDLSASLSRAKASEAQTAGFLNAGSTILSGAARVAGQGFGTTPGSTITPTSTQINNLGRLSGPV